MVDIEQAISDGILNNDWQAFESWLIDVAYNDPWEPGQRQWALEFASQVLSRLDDAEFLRNKHNSKVIFALEGVWDALDVIVKDKLMRKLVQAYPVFEDELSLFVIAELIGEKYANDEGLNFAHQIHQSSRDVLVKSLAPMAYEKIIRNALDSKVRDRALDALYEIHRSGQSQERFEVEISLQRLLAAGFQVKH